VISDLKKLRKEKGETQIQLARILGLKTASAYCKKENGKSSFTIMEIKLLAKHFKKPISFFCE